MVVVYRANTPAMATLNDLASSLGPCFVGGTGSLLQPTTPVTVTFVFLRSVTHHEEATVVMVFKATNEFTSVTLKTVPPCVHHRVTGSCTPPTTP